MQRLLGRGVRTGEQGAKARGRGEQHGGLAFDHAQVGGLVRIGVAYVQQLQHLAFGDRVGGVGKDPHHFHALEFHHELETARVQEVADQHAGGVAPYGVRGAPSAAQVRFVDHVVVQQGGGVDELDHRRELVRVLAAMAERARGKQQQHGPQPLAAGADDVFAHLVDQDHVRGQPAPDQRIDAGHVVGGQGLDLGQGEGGRRERRGVHGRGQAAWAAIIGTRHTRNFPRPGSDNR